MIAQAKTIYPASENKLRANISKVQRHVECYYHHLYRFYASLLKFVFTLSCRFSKVLREFFPSVVA